MKINLKNVKNALNRDEMRSISGGGKCQDQVTGYSINCSNNSGVCPPGCTCKCTTTVHGRSVSYCCE